MSADDRRIRRIAIVGGGTAGWMAASVLARSLPGTGTAITLIESPEIGTVGVGEATIPPILDALRFLSIDEADFVRNTQATYKLGIKFSDWKQLGHSYWHPFGAFGAPINRRPFHHFWHRAQAEGLAHQFNEFSVCATLGDAGKFRFPDTNPDSPAAGLRYALHFDATLVAKYLRAYAERLGVVRLERMVIGATLRADGFLDELQFSDGPALQADLYIDCSGFHGALIEKVLGTGYLDWSAMLPCDRAVAFPTAPTLARPPYTRARARTAGWQWRIPLQHRTGNGHVYSSAHMSDERAQELLLGNLDSKALAEPRPIRFTTGRRRQLWNRNVVALGLASGFLEPLESTAIHLIQVTIQRLILLFPDRGDNTHRRDEFNRSSAAEYEYVRDFIILHYHANNRVGDAFWDDCRNMSVPDSLTHKIELFRETGGIFCPAQDLFQLPSWLQVMWGQGIKPRAAHPFVEAVSPTDRADYLKGIRELIADAARKLPRHEDFIARHCQAP